MEFSLTKEQEMIRKTAREFAEKEIAPIAADIDEKAEFPAETVRKLGELGFMGMTVPREWGGSGMDDVSYAIAVEELSRVCASHGVTMSVNNSLVCWPLTKFGTDAQKEKYLKPLASGKKLGCFGLTEPNAGTDAAGQTTIATKTESGYSITGSKIFITNGPAADVAIIFAMTDKSKGTRGISTFIIEKEFPGFSIGSIENKMGIRGSCTSELVFENMFVPEENMLGKEGQGFKIAMATLDGGRIGIAAQALGIAQAAYEESVKYAKQREQFGKPISSFQAIQWFISDMATEIDAARLLVYKAAFDKWMGRPYTVSAAMAKFFASDVAMKATRNAIQVHGGYGYTKEYPVERFYRDAKITEIYEGTTEVQKMVISADLLK
ncbi:MAG: acyl-CoA dehydrogenase [Candidatus Thermoplasmatota archaeon]|nr:acyl-CoA dehydrogenase [Euryarchaeota archaeon]MBU4032818.1 acyl-CoA dehydrogenase [Candidatus Thermoplasmatota archaeon]MBU4071543.1 acyl-CoA dehydrogenase [Candidatus Thermoplasmatota archaeon]MBU4144497.1 acyl-CoA dehydrogenase [Candidatus Thermoplasmatota archaeon]MBU4592709.1 acyl-CoA dehydrogenase [Candidatus Thermoplasmatota archaeon]